MNHLFSANLNNGIKMEVTFRRILTNELLTTYLPSFFLLGICYATTFFKQFYFEAAVTVNLTVMLVATTLFIRLTNRINNWQLTFKTNVQCNGQASSCVLCKNGWHMADHCSTDSIHPCPHPYYYWDLWRSAVYQSSWKREVERRLQTLLLLQFFV